MLVLVGLGLSQCLCYWSSGCLEGRCGSSSLLALSSQSEASAVGQVSFLGVLGAPAAEVVGLRSGWARWGPFTPAVSWSPGTLLWGGTVTI